jgi:hypothetical protein
MKGQIKTVKLNKFKYDKELFKTNEEYKNHILYTLAFIKTF